MNPLHRYAVSTEWTGNTGSGTSGYRAYERSTRISVAGKPILAGSADRAFFGDAEKWNPEDLLLAALSQCHLLSYLHVAVLNRVVVVGYTDEATGIMEETGDGGGHFTSVTLRPRVLVAEPNMVGLANSLHTEANSKCFIAASVNFSVLHEPQAFVLA